MKLPHWLHHSRGGALLGLSLEDNGLAVARVRRVNGECQVEAGLVVPLTAERLLADPPEAGRLLAGVLNEREWREKRCAVRLPLAWAMGVALELPDLAGTDLDSFLELRAEREFPFPPGRAALAHRRFRLSAKSSWGLLVGLDQGRVEAVRRALETAGLQPVSISLGRGGCVPPDAPESEAVLHVCPAGAGWDLVLTAGEDLAGFRHWGGTAREAGAAHAVTAPELAREIRLTRGRLPAELRSAFRAVRFHGPEGRVGDLFRECEPLLRARGWETVERAPCRALPMADGAPLPAPAEPALEVACRWLSDEPAAFEFLPPRVNRWEQAFRRYGRGRRRQAILASVALLLALGAPAWLQARKLAALETRWAAMEPRVKQLEAVQENIRRFRSWFDNRPVTLEALRAVTQAFPEEGSVWARALELKPGGVFTCTGLARDNQALMATLDRLRKNPRVSELKVRQMRGRDPVRFSFQFTWNHDARS